MSWIQDASGSKLESVPKRQSDFGITFTGCIATLYTYSQKARNWVATHLSYEPWQCERIGSHITSIHIDSRFACDIMQLIVNDGTAQERNERMRIQNLVTVDQLDTMKANELIDFLGFDCTTLESDQAVYSKVLFTLAQLTGQSKTENFSGQVGFPLVDSLTGKIKKFAHDLILTGNKLSTLYPKRPLIYAERRSIPIIRLNCTECFDMLKIDLSRQHFYKISVENCEIIHRQQCAVRVPADVLIYFKAIDKGNENKACKDIFEVETSGVRFGVVGYFDDYLLVDYSF
jgi:hypothetical protein